jgi:hypothetical protein
MKAEVLTYFLRAAYLPADAEWQGIKHDEEATGPVEKTLPTRRYCAGGRRHLLDGDVMAAL